MNTAITRIDSETGKKYFKNNIPVGRLNAMTGITGRRYKICAQNGNDSVWYNGRFLGDQYAVFVYVEKCGFWQQISPWYERYGNAVRYMTHKCG